MLIKDGHKLADKYERLLAVRQARNGKPLTVYGRYRDTNALRAYICKYRLTVTMRTQTIDAEKDVVKIEFNAPK